MKYKNKNSCLKRGIRIFKRSINPIISHPIISGSIATIVGGIVIWLLFNSPKTNPPCLYDDLGDLEGHVVIGVVIDNVIDGFVIDSGNENVVDGVAKGRVIARVVNSCIVSRIHDGVVDSGVVVGTVDGGVVVGGGVGGGVISDSRPWDNLPINPDASFHNKNAKKILDRIATMRDKDTKKIIG